ncbi:MAG: FG-GAP-like repeat-containing protein [Bacteroidota bacterium]
MRKLIYILTVSLLGQLAVGQCNAESSLNEDFESWNGAIDPCWSTLTSGALVYEDTGGIVFYSLFSPNTPTMLVSPELNSGTYNLQFDAVDIAGSGLQIEVGTLTSNNDSSTFNSLGSAMTVIGMDTHSMSVTLNQGEYLAFSASLPGNHNAIALDNIVLSATTSNIFTQETTSLADYFFPSSDWSDIDGDGDLDLVISGALDADNDELPDTSKIDFYLNDGGTFVLNTQTNVGDLHLGTVKFLDVDNDGDEDLITSGQNYNDITSYSLTVYENSSGSFTNIQELEGIIFSSIDAGDYDNDGDLDLLVAGAWQNNGADVQTRIYTNENGVFTNANAGLPGTQQGNAVFGDLDADGDLDILLSGYDSNFDNYGQIFVNDAGSFTAGSVPFETGESWATLGDYDNDGDLDIAYTGYDENFDYISKILNNDGDGNFSDSGIALEGTGNFSGTTPVVWGDYDNDGDLDLVFSGTDNNFAESTYIYRNDGSTFTSVDEGLINLGSSANLSFADFDGDNDLDILISGYFDDAASVSQTVYHTNGVAIANQAPNSPTNLSSQLNTDNSITFSWDDPTDDFTPSSGLFYYLTVGTSSGGEEIASYAVYGNSWTINGLDDSVNYFWSVSSVDTAFVFSSPATDETLSNTNFEIDNRLIVFPNPSVDKIVNISFQNSTWNEGSIEIMDMAGKLVRIESINPQDDASEYRLDLSKLESGIYLLKLTNDDSATTKKIVLK